jgi:N-acetyl-alpha-D-muramate 1-phosphate uridylyltransferase
MHVKAQAILLAAGRGERMRPLTDNCPKPLLQVRGKPLMQWPLEAMLRGGLRGVVVNTAWLGEQIEARFSNGIADSSFDTFSSKTGLQVTKNVRKQLSEAERLAGASPASHAACLRITYSHEGRDFGGALETAGGIARALPRLDDVFWVAAGDVFAPDFEFTQKAMSDFKASGKLAHLWLVPNPEHNPNGDFGLDTDALALNLPKGSPQPQFTYSTIGLYRQALFALPFCQIPPGNPQGVKAALAPLLRAAMDTGHVSGELYHGAWADVGTPARLDQLNRNGPSISGFSPR